MKNFIRLLLIQLAIIIVIVPFTSCKKNNIEDDNSSNIEISYDKEMRTGQNVPVVFMGVQHKIEHDLGDGNKIVQITCELPYSEICLILSVPEEALRNGNNSDLSGTIIIYGDEESSDGIPLNVEIPVHNCTIDRTNNSIEFVPD